MQSCFRKRGVLMLVAGLIAAAVAPSAATSAAICEVGRFALRDLPAINHNRRFDSYYAGADPNHRDLLEACPMLASELPTGFPLADDEARSRAADHGPLPGKDPAPAFIYAIDIPEVSDDLKTAIVHMGYSCSGLCGARFEVRYIRTAKGW